MVTRQFLDRPSFAFLINYLFSEALLFPFSLLLVAPIISWLAPKRSPFLFPFSITSNVCKEKAKTMANQHTSTHGFCLASSGGRGRSTMMRQPHRVPRKLNNIIREQALHDVGQLGQDLIFDDAGTKELISFEGCNWM